MFLRLTVLLGRSDFFNSESVVEVLSRREVVTNVVLDEFDTKIGCTSQSPSVSQR